MVDLRNAKDRVHTMIVAILLPIIRDENRQGCPVSGPGFLTKHSPGALFNVNCAEPTKLYTITINSQSIQIKTHRASWFDQRLCTKNRCDTISLGRRIEPL